MKSEIRNTNYDTNPKATLLHCESRLRWWRIVVVGVSTLILCSCRSPFTQPLPDVAEASPPPASNVRTNPFTLAAEANAQTPFAAQSPHIADVKQAAFQSQPIPPAASPFHQSVRRVAAQSPAYSAPPYPEQVIVPPGQAVVGRPQPPGEYLYDGGDRNLPALVSPEWIVQGLEPEDTIGHADTLDGRVLVTPSNRVEIYAPRFAAVRNVVDLVQGRRIAGVQRQQRQMGLKPLTDAQGIVRHLQNVQLRGDRGAKRLQGFRTRDLTNADVAMRRMAVFQDVFSSFENLAVIRRGQLENTDKPLLALGKQAAVAWSHDLGVQAMVAGRSPIAVTGDARAKAVFKFEDKRGPAKLRVIKVASTVFAQPGDLIDFTIRFDNLGEQAMGNVTILDSLTSRLHYIPDSAQSSLKADFIAKENEAGSMVLRWDIVNPVVAGEGGLVRFKCRVR